MRIDTAVRRCVVFLGHADFGNDDSFRAAGTGFLLAHEGTRYLATVQHIAREFDDNPFVVRVNCHDGTSHSVHCDPLEDPDCRWFAHPNPNIDLAILPWNFSEGAFGLDLLSIDNSMLLRDEQIKELQIDAGDICHAVGLFRLLQGSQRNVPLVHTGNIAMMAGVEPIPVRDWARPNSGQIRLVDGYLVEMSNLKGLSGAPVLVRPSCEGVAQTLVRDAAGGIAGVGKPTTFAAFDIGVRVLGVWQASWDALPDQVMALEGGPANRVPIGLGTVVPAGRLVELLELDEVVEHRKAMYERARQRAEIA